MLLITIIKYNFIKMWTKFSRKKGQLSLTFYLILYTINLARINERCLAH